MKRFIGLLVATTAVVIPLSASGASAAPAPSEYQAGCDQLYNGGKPLFDALITNAKAVVQPLEKSFCGDNKYAK